MNKATNMKHLLAVLVGTALLHTPISLAAEPGSPTNGFAFASRDGTLAIAFSGQRVADYVYRDERIPRPYFANLCAPGGLQVSRNHPPVPGKDPNDHDALHPGVWLAFADVSGHDSWRNLAAIKHERFTDPPTVRDGRLTFATESRMLTTNGQPLCTLLSRITLAARPAGYLLVWDATYMADVQDFAFGDQEEMGLGVRVATPIIEKNGGRIITSTGGKTAKATWGKSFDWCDYSGVIGDRRAGVTLMPDPANFRPSWFHNRDYGLMVANPFGRSSMKQGDVSRVEVKKGEKLRLRFGLLLHAAAPGQEVDLPASYRDFLGQLPRTSPLRGAHDQTHLPESKRNIMQSSSERNERTREGSRSSLQQAEPQNAGRPKVLLVVGDGAEVMDTLYPFFRLGEHYRVVVAAPQRRRYHLVIHELAEGWDITQERAGYHLESEVAFKEVAAEEYDALVLPGGRAPEYLRYDPDLMRITKDFFAANKPVASVCHGIEILAIADVLRGRKVTTIPKCRFDATVCGAEYVEDPVVRCGNLICARGKKDMSPWMQQFVPMIEDHLARMKAIEH